MALSHQKLPTEDLTPVAESNVDDKTKKVAEPTPITVSDIEKIAETRLAKPVLRYYVDGADKQITTHRNKTIYDELLLGPRILRDVTNIDLLTTIFGKRYDISIAIAPSAYQKLVGHVGEVDVAQASWNLGSNFILSSNATTSLEDVMASVRPRHDCYPAPWFQLYFLYSHEITKGLIERAEKAGYEALVLTVDTVIVGNRLFEHNEPLKLPPNLSLANLTTIKGGGASKGRLLLLAKTAAEACQVVEKHSDYLVDASLDWREVIPWLRSQTSLKIILKRILTAEDAALAVEADVDAIVVSKHGGRQLDGVPTTLEVLPEIVDVVRGRMHVIFDGGITKGTDVFKALALGADLLLAVQPFGVLLTTARRALRRSFTS